jgi:hypothetical protein
MRVVTIGAVELFDAYYRVMDQAKPERWDARRAIEVRKRLVQLDWLLLEVQKREVAAVAMPSELPRLATEMETLVEAFYYLAFRASKVIETLPGLGAFKASGIRDVRNHLVEHPERPDSGIYSIGFVWGAERGLVLRGVRLDSDSQEWQDAGLYSNAQEVRDQLVSLLAPYLSRDPGPA